MTVEEHNVLGGLGGAVAELLAQEAPTPLVRVGVEDCFCETVGPYDEMVAHYGLDAAGIAAAAHRALERKLERKRTFLPKSRPRRNQPKSAKEPGEP